MMNTLIQSIALFFRDGSSDKEYNVTLEETNGGYLVNFNYGRRGNATTTGTKTSKPVDLAEAQKIYDKLVKEKRGKGYVPDGDAKPFSDISGAGESTGLFPMLLTPIEMDELEFYLQNPQWLMQEKLDGKRIVVQVKDGQVIASNRKTLIVGIPQEIEKELATLNNCILDGELVGTTYYVFDITSNNDIDFDFVGCLDRYLQLTQLPFGNMKSVKLVSCATTEADKRSLHSKLLHKEGVVLKKIDSVYKAGKGETQLKCKFWSDTTVLVEKVNGKRSVSIAIASQNHHINVGNVTIPPNYDIPAEGKFIDVKYLYAYPNGCLYQPIYRGERDDKDVADDIQTLKYKSEDSDED